MPESKRRKWIVSVGIGSLWAWAFCLFPSAGMRSPLEETGVTLQMPNWQVSLIAGTVINILVAILHEKVSDKEKVRGALSLCGTTAQVVCYVLMLSGGVGQFWSLASGILSGCSIGLLWTLWLMLLERMDLEEVESSFVAALLMNVLVFFVVALIPAPLRGTFFVGLSFIQMGAYFLFIFREGRLDPGRSQHKICPSSRHEKGDSIALAISRCLVAFAFVSFAASSFSSTLHSEQPGISLLFSFGMFAGVVAFQLFMYCSNRVDIFGSARWVFPIASFALVFGVGTPVLNSLGIFMMGLVHIAFEGMVRLGVMSLARRSGLNYVKVVSAGLAAISLGALIGVNAFRVFYAVVGDVTTLVPYALAALVAIVLLLFAPSSAKTESEPVLLGNEQVCKKMQESYGLTPRETEVLGYLIEGRSHPFIRDELHISKGTVDTHVRHIYEKTGISSKQELISLSHSLKEKGNSF